MTTTAQKGPSARGDSPAVGEPAVEPGGGVRSVKSALRTIEALEFLASRQGTMTRLRDVAEGLGSPRSSTYALLQTLVAAGWVEVDETGTFYSVGIRALLAGTSYIDRDQHVRIVHPILADLSAQLGETFHMARLDGQDVVYLATAESHEYGRLLPRVGRRLPSVHTSLGKAILAERPDLVPTEMPAPITSHSLTSIGALTKELDLTRERGYAIDDEENTPGVRCLGLALRYDHPVRDAISCSVPIDRMAGEHEQQVLQAMRTARNRIEASASPVRLA